jgi:hypothetical protein
MKYAVAALATSVMLGAPVAHADTFPGDHNAEAFEQETGTNDGQSPTGEELAEHICQFLESGHTAKEAIDGGVTSRGAQRVAVEYFVFDSEFHFCPDELHKP